MELWDAYNADYEKIEGAVLVRGEDNTFPEGMRKPDAAQHWPGSRTSLHVQNAKG